MKKEMTLTDKLLAGALFVSVTITLLHNTIPAIICITILFAVTAFVSAMHLKQTKTKTT